MDEYIINSFIFKNINQFDDIFNYILNHSKNKDITKNDVSYNLKYLIKNNIINIFNESYSLTTEGNFILKTNIIFYKRILYRFFYKITNSNIYIKQFELKEKRLEQNSLRNNLIKTKEHKCILCDKYLPLCLLETAHIKPRSILSRYDLHNINIVEFMCRYCHTLYDSGFLSVSHGLLFVSSKLNNYFDLSYTPNKQILSYNSYNNRYFEFHYKNIFIP